MVQMTSHCSRESKVIIFSSKLPGRRCWSSNTVFKNLTGRPWVSSTRCWTIPQLWLAFWNSRISRQAKWQRAISISKNHLWKQFLQSKKPTNPKRSRLIASKNKKSEGKSANILDKSNQMMIALRKFKIKNMVWLKNPAASIEAKMALAWDYPVEMYKEHDRQALRQRSGRKSQASETLSGISNRIELEPQLIEKDGGSLRRNKKKRWSYTKRKKKKMRSKKKRRRRLRPRKKDWRP